MRLIDADELEVHKGTIDDWYTHEFVYKDDIDDAPTIEIPKWISCEERLPEISGEYLIMVDVPKTAPFAEIDWFYADDKEWSHRNAKVLAWMPIPEFKRGE